MSVVLTSTFGAISVSAQQPTAAGKPAEQGPLTEFERTEFLSELNPLRERLRTLRTTALNEDRWADAALFVKGVIWALDFGPINDTNSRELVRKGLRRARQRIEALEAGRHPWSEKRGRSVRGFVSEVDGSVQPYHVVIPSGYDPSRPIRLDVVLHGSMAATGIGELRFINAFDGGDEDETPVPANNFIELRPMGRLGENAYRFEGETDVDEAIEAVCRDYRIDRSRMVLRGSSLGGVGTWQLGLKRPDRYVALGPAAGPVDTFVFAGAPWKHFVRLEPLTPWQKTMLHLVDAIDYTANARMVNVVAAMGDKDPYYDSHLLIEKEFAKEDIPFEGLVDAGAGHSITPRVMEEQLRRLGEHAEKGRDPFPRQIQFVTWTLKFSRCHWAEILGLQSHYQRASIQADVASDQSINVRELRNITRFAIHPPALQTDEATLSVSGSQIKLPDLSVRKNRPVVIDFAGDDWRCLGTLDAANLSGKRPGLQGPIDDAFARPFVCVRGTGQPWNTSVATWADANLNRFREEWRRHYRGELPVKDDTELTEQDVRQKNLILFGDPGSNSWISRILTHLPIKWTRDTLELGSQVYSARDHGVQLIHPNPLPGGEGRYLVLNSGHTYHDQELRFSYMVFPRLGDWAIVKVGENRADTPAANVAETILDSGFFNEDWKWE